MRILSSIGKIMSVMILSFLTSTVAFGQDSITNMDTDLVTSNFNKGPFYAQLWFWIVIGMVFLLLLIALIRGGGRKEEN